MKPYIKVIVTAIFVVFASLFFQAPFARAKIYTNKLGMRFVLIPAGQFLMGSPESEKGRQWNENRHRVIIS